jgi:hypothetical protein
LGNISFKNSASNGTKFDLREVLQEYYEVNFRPNTRKGFLKWAVPLKLKMALNIHDGYN